MSVPMLVSNEPTDDERRLIQYHLAQLQHFRKANQVHERYYEGQAVLATLGFSIPPELSSLEVVVGWPGTVVDVLDERLDWHGWASPDSTDPLQLESIYLDNSLDLESDQAHLDALIYGCSFVVVGNGGPGEPSPLVTIESPNRMTGAWDARLRRLTSALGADFNPGGTPTKLELFLPDQVVVLEPGRGGWVVVDRQLHNIGRVPVVKHVNRPRASNPFGRSEITHPLRVYTDSAVRTLLGMEVHREFYQAPQRWVLGAADDAFTDAEGNVRTGWEAVMGRLLVLPANEDTDQLPQVGQFAQSSPAPYLEQIRGLGELVAAEAGIPSSYLGFYTANPTSADAIRAAEARLIKRAERRQAAFGRAWREVGALAIAFRDGVSLDNIPAEYRAVTPIWRDPATPTRSAAADEAVKLVGAGILPPDSTVTYERIGLSAADQRRLQSDRRRAQATSALAALTQPPAPTTEVTPNGNNGGNLPPGAE